jgi:hypothetical protein
LPRHSHVASHLAFVSYSKCESGAVIAIPQLFASRRPETEYEAEFPLSAN